MYGKQRQAEEGFVGDGEAFLCFIAEAGGGYSIPPAEIVVVCLHCLCSSRRFGPEMPGAALA
ncbi:hypothetical protein ACLBWT_02570 [Paenibacillus sp. D51F]